MLQVLVMQPTIV